MKSGSGGCSSSSSSYQQTKGETVVLGNVSGTDVVLDGDLIILANPSAQIKLSFEDLGVINGLIARAVKESE
jgi:hypothetical protein